MSIYQLQQAFARCTPEQEAQALKKLVSAYMAQRKADNTPRPKVSLLKHRKEKFEPNNAQRINLNE